MIQKAKLLFSSGWLQKLCGLLLTLYWLTSLRQTDSFFSVYLLCALLGMAAAVENQSHPLPLARWQRWLTAGFAALFSCAVVLANYPLFVPFAAHGVAILLCLVAGFWLACQLLVGLLRWAGRCGAKSAPAQRAHPARVFWLTFGAVAAVDLVYLFGVAYPGSLTRDSVSQMEQLLTNVYSNHHPFWHTLVVKLWVSLGAGVFGQLNAGVALYSCFSVLFLAAVFAYAVMSLYQARLPMPWVVAAFCLFVLSPYNIAYSVTMWKDVLFGGAVAAFVTALFRLLYRVGGVRGNYVVLAAASLGFGLWRSNGWFAFFLTVLVALALFYKTNRRLVLTLAALLVITFGMKHAVLYALHVPQPDTVETFSIPAQQLARLIVDDVPLTQQERQQLSLIFDLEAVPQEYTSWISDPIKENIRRAGQSHLNEHKLEYLLLWVKLGLKHPVNYIEAWVDETKGYWNGGYDYWIWATWVEENDLGLCRTTASPLLEQGYYGYFNAYCAQPLCEPLRSIGLHTWAAAAALYLALAQKRKNAILAAPCLAIALSLVISTPVYSEFRYAYALFVSLPIFFPAILCAPSPES